MRFLQFCCVLSILLMSHADFVLAQHYTGDRPRRHLPTAALRHAGLEMVWQTHVSVDSSRGRVAHMTPHISHTTWLAEYEVTFNDDHLVFREGQLGPFRRHMDRERAAQLADLEIRVLKTRDVTAELVTHKIPNVTLFVQTDRAVLHSIDGETGRTMWTVAVGQPNYPNLSPGANDRYAAVVNGSTLYVLDRIEEKVAWQQSLSAAPGAGPVLTGDRIFVPLVNGLVEGFELDDAKYPTVRLRSIGQAMVQPRATPSSIYWPTNRGYLYVADSRTGDLRFRLETGSHLIANAAYRDPDQLFASTVDGYVYMVNELTGELRWRHSVGESIATAPAVIGDHVYVVSASHTLVCMAAETGADVWTTPGVKQFLAATSARAYCLGARGDLVAVDRQTGTIQAIVPLADMDFSLTNGLTDRIYLGTRTGKLMCLRESQMERPLVHIAWSPEETPQDDQATPAATDSAAEGGTDSESMDEAAAELNPFGGEDAPVGDDVPATDVPEDMGDAIDDGSDVSPFDLGDEAGDENPFDLGGDEGNDENPFDFGDGAGDSGDDDGLF